MLCIYRAVYVCTSETDTAEYIETESGGWGYPVCMAGQRVITTAHQCFKERIMVPGDTVIAGVYGILRYVIRIQCMIHLSFQSVMSVWTKSFKQH